MKRFFMTMGVVLTGVMLLAGVAGAAIYDSFATNIGDGYYHYYSGPGGDYFVGDSENIAVSYYSYSVRVVETGYIQYSLADAPAPADITSVTLNIDYSPGIYQDGKVYYLPNATAANGNAAQRLNGTVLVHEFADSAGWLSLDVTNLILTDLENGRSWAPFSFHSYSNYHGYNIKAAESGSPSYLEFTYAVPVPPSALLLFTGLLGFVGFRRRQG